MRRKGQMLSTTNEDIGDFGNLNYTEREKKRKIQVNARVKWGLKMEIK